MIEELKSNLEKESKIAHEIILLAHQFLMARGEEKAFFENSITSLLDALSILNDSVPQIIAEEAKELVTRPARVGTSSLVVTITKEQKRDFLKDLKIEEDALNKLRKKIKTGPEQMEKTSMSIIYKPNPFVTMSSRMFQNISFSLSAQLKSVGDALKKANMPYLLNSYISMAIFGTLAAFVVGIIAAIVLTILYPGNILMTIPRNILISLALPLFTIFMFYIYPFSQAASIGTKINDELPFVIMHMSAIAGSGVEPTRVFSIIATTKDYPITSIEIRKLINQINFYGYDLITALKETAKTTSSERLRDLLNGIATTVASGGDLRLYLDKKSSDTMLDYKLRRQRYVSISGTYADVYTGLLIAAPLIFMLILSIIGSMGLGGLDPKTVGIVGITGIIALNIGFLIFLQVSQPES